jgi:hypothetical protein
MEPLTRQYQLQIRLEIVAVDVDPTDPHYVRQTNERLSVSESTPLGVLSFRQMLGALAGLHAALHTVPQITDTIKTI